MEIIVSKTITVLLYPRKNTDKDFRFTHCHKCNKEFVCGEKILSRRCNKTKRYHYDCAVLVNLQPELYDNTGGKL